MEHHVYFWLKEEFCNEAGFEQMERALDALCMSSYVSEASWGKPARTEVRAVTDHSWDYGISFKFAGLDDHDRYQKADPVHDRFLAENKDSWAKVLVMDLG